MQTSGLKSQQFSNRMRVFRGTSKSLSGLVIVDWWMRTRPGILAIRKKTVKDTEKKTPGKKYEVEEHLIPPEPVLVDASEAVDDDGDRQSEDENLK